MFSFYPSKWHPLFINLYVFVRIIKYNVKTVQVLSFILIMFQGILWICHNMSYLYLLKLISLSTRTSVVMPTVLEDMFPYLTKSSHFEHYCRNILTVTTYMPTLRIELMELVIKIMLKLDVSWRFVEFLLLSYCNWLAHHLIYICFLPVLALFLVEKC